MTSGMGLPSVVFGCTRHTMSFRISRRVFLLLFLVVIADAACAEQVTAAVAANFTSTITRLAPDFEHTTGHKLVVSVGATGKLYAQIANAAPFDVLLSADDETPRRMETEGLAVPGTRFTYAIGRLVLWSPQPGIVDSRGDILRTGDMARLAIANPKTAPYGAAAVQTMKKLGAWERLSQRLVYGENIAQTLQFVSSGNATAGFVALAQVRALPASQAGSLWIVPVELHEPLRQDAVLLKRAAGNTAARAFLEYLRSTRAKIIIEELGYTIP